MRLANRAFFEPRRPSEAAVALRRRRTAGQRVSAAVSGGRLVGTFRSWDLDLPVPGGTAPAEAISSVTVAATHRRRGVLSAMMSDDLAAARESGAVLAVLIASEAPIYGRFGFSPATEACRWALDSRSARFLVDPVGDGDVMLEAVEDADLADLAPALYAEAAAGMPGAMPRDGLWWQVALGLVEVPGRDPGEVHPAVVARDSGGRAVGTARYRVQEAWEARRPRSVVEVLDLSATTPAAHTALWRFLAEVDLTVTVTASTRPVHEPLPWLLADRRAAAQLERADLQWVRLLDVAGALRARRYAAPGRVVLEVVDPTGHDGGRLDLQVAEDGTAAVGRTTAEPDVVLDLAALSGAYLGQVGLQGPQAAGRVDERTPGSLARLGALLAWTPTTAVGHTWF